MAQKSAIFICDASAKIGLGHIYRSMAVAHEMVRQGISSEIFTPPLDEALREKIATFGIPHREYTSTTELSQSFYVFVDLSERNPTLADWLKGCPARRIALDTFQIHQIPYDFFVCPHFEESQIPRNTPTRLLEGLTYLIFLPSLLEAAKLSRQRPRNTFNKVLVTLGGADPHQRMPEFARCLSALKADFRYVLGPAFSEANRQALLQVLDRDSVLIAPPDLSQAYAWADLAITAGGLSKFEATLFGLPTLLLPQNDLEERLSLDFAQRGTAKILGRTDRICGEDLFQSVSQILEQTLELKKMAQQALKIIDGKGAERVVAAVLALK